MIQLPDNFDIPRWFLHRWVWHAVFWLVYFFVIMFEDFTAGIWTVKDYWKLCLIGHPPSFLAVYLTTFWVVPNFLYQKKYILFALFCIVTAVLSSLLGHYIFLCLDPDLLVNGTNLNQFQPHPLEGVSITVLLVLLAASLKLGKDMLLSAQLRADRTAQNMAGELLALRQQISPHFLLNSLNTIYGLALTEPKGVAPAVLTLSDLLRFSLYETRTDRVPLDRELDFLKNCIAMQSLRASEKLEISTAFPENIPNPGPDIAPLLLLVFLENAFKFAQSNAQGERFLHLKINFNVAQSTLFFECENTFLAQQQPSEGGLGLENVRRRLTLIYPEKHSLELRSKAGVWSVNLEIQLAQ